MHIDIPLGSDQDDAISVSNQIMGHCLSQERDFFKSLDIEKINVRLGHDDDRQKSNYLKMNENGHVSNKKISIDI